MNKNFVENVYQKMNMCYNSGTGKAEFIDER